MKLFNPYIELALPIKIGLGTLPFLVIIVCYLMASEGRLSENPADKVFPSPNQMLSQVGKLVFGNEKQAAVLLQDTKASLTRLTIGVSLSAFAALSIGILMGALPSIRATLLPFVTFFSIVPPIALMPIILILVGVGEVGKVFLIFIGTVSTITRDIYLSTRQIPMEYLTKAVTLGASGGQLLTRIILPQIMPRLLEALRIALGAAWIFLIVGEAIVASEGLGYRIFLVRRFLAMDIIIPYVIWLTLLGLSMDGLLRLSLKLFFPWYRARSQ